MDNELFELCKEVYEKTGWGDGSDMNKVNWHDYYDDWSIPLYTSDYLLEKLPKSILNKDTRNNDPLRLYVGENTCSASYHTTFHPPLYEEPSDTPLKALLKLAIALDDAGVKL